MDWEKEAREKFAVKKPKHFTDFEHCPECAEHDETLLGSSIDQIGINELGNPGWDPMCFCSAEGRVKRDDLQPLPIKAGEIKLLSVAFSIEADIKYMHATLSAVNKYFFCMALSECLKPYKNSNRIFIKHVRQSWRSNIESISAPT